MTSEAIRLSFLTDQAEVVTLRVTRVNPSVTSSEILSAMDNIIVSEALNTNGRGNIISRHRADLVVTTVTHFDV